MKVAIINGPNLNLIGTREPEIYGSEGFDSLLKKLKSAFPSIEISYFQSNIEGEIVDAIQRSGFSHNGIILNAGGYTHTSVAIADAVAAVPALVIEVHLSNIFAREEVRRTSLLSEKVKGVISGFGMSSYEMALLFITKSLNTSQ